MKRFYLALLLLLLLNNFGFADQKIIDWSLSPEEVRQTESGTFRNDNKNKNNYSIHFTKKFEDCLAYIGYHFSNGKLVEKYIHIQLIDLASYDTVYRKNWYLNYYDTMLKDFNNEHGKGKIVYFNGVLDKSHKWVTKDTIIISDILVTDHFWRFMITYSWKWKMVFLPQWKAEFPG